MHFSSAPIVVKAIQQVDGNQCLLSDSTARIQCQTAGFPQPSIVFFSGNTEVDLSDDHFSVDCDKLVIEGVTPEDAGVYTCVASSEDDDSRSDNFTFIYCSKPRYRIALIDTTKLSFTNLPH